MARISDWAAMIDRVTAGQIGGSGWTPPAAGVQPGQGGTTPAPPRTGPAPMRPAAYVGGPLPVVYGTGRLSGTVVFQSNLRSSQAANYNFYDQIQVIGGDVVEAIIAICEAPVAAVNRVWFDQKVKAANDLSSLLVTSGGIIEFVVGAASPAWTVLNAYPDAAGMAFEGTVYMRAQGLRLNSGKVPDLSFEVKGRCAGADGEAHPADVFQDLCNDARVGLNFTALGIDVITDVGSDGLAASSYRNYCTAQGFRVSRVIKDRGDAIKALEELLVATNSTAVPSISSDGARVAIKIIPLGDEAKTANGATYTPPAVIPITNDDEVILDGDNPVESDRVPESNVFNCFPITFGYKATDYSESTQEFIDPGHASAYGLRRAGPVSIPWITDAAHALKISTIMAAQSINARNSHRFKLGPRWVLLECGDLISLSETVGYGLSGKTIRITKIRDLKDGLREIEGIEWPVGIEPVDLTPQTQDGYNSPSVLPVDPWVQGKLASEVAAAAAQAAADAEQAALDATTALADIASDAKLTPVEKSQVLREYKALLDEKVGILAEAARYGVNADAWCKDADNTGKLNILYSYMAGLGLDIGVNDAAWQATTTDIVGATFRQRFTDVYSTRQGVLNGIAAAAKALADRAVGGGNLLYNSSFEIDSNNDGSPDGFVPYGAGAVLTPQTGGLYGGKFLRVSWTGGNAGEKGFIAISSYGGGVVGGWRSGVWYTVTVYARATGTSVGQKLEIRWNTMPDGASANRVISEGATVLSANWQRFTFRFKWSGSVESMGALHMSLAYQSNTTGTVDFDAVKVEEGEIATAYAPMAREILPGTVTRSDTTIANLDNLFPNPTSEMAPPTGADPNDVEWAWRSNIVAFSGSYCRYMNNTSGAEVQLGPYIPAAEGDTFYMEARCLYLAGSDIAGIYFGAFDANKAWIGGAHEIVGDFPRWVAAPAGWTQIAAEYKAPAGTAFIRPYLFVRNNVTVAFDAIYCRRSFDTRAATGQLAEATVRSINGIGKRGSSGQLVWKGMDTGVPWVVDNAAGANSRILVKRVKWSSTYRNAEFLIYIKGLLNTDNLDSTRVMEIWAYEHASYGSVATLNDLGYQVHSVSSRRVTLPDDAQNWMNCVAVTAVYAGRTITAGYYPALKVQIANHFGSSGLVHFATALNEGSGDDQFLHCYGTAWPGSSGSPPPSGGGDTDPWCVGPDTLILLADNSFARAGLIQPGAQLLTIADGELSAHPATLSAVSVEESERVELFFDDDTSLVCSHNHRLWVGGRGWVEASDIWSGERVDGYPRTKLVTGRLARGPGQVVRLTVDGARTYVSNGVISHNAKKQQ